jgi:hypothetical protein
MPVILRKTNEHERARLPIFLIAKVLTLSRRMLGDARQNT